MFTGLRGKFRASKADRNKEKASGDGLEDRGKGDKKI